jgi:DNA-binding XRE family transcriptional regulator
MDARKRKKLESAGWKIGDAADFLELDPKELAYLELKLALAFSVQKTRRAQKLTQTQMARKIKSSQSRVAKMEAADPSVTLDLLIRSLIELDVTKVELAKLMVSRPKPLATKKRAV